uniref:Centromere protein Cenp-F N-terminal domain-containing protein n=1 Tax=Theropithecus gelada TaxID=9565 RepID=A0A8D2FLH9_THEGE
MSWALEEWKEGLPTRALQKIQELEGQLDKLKKEKQQRQFQLDSLEAALQKQKQKVPLKLWICSCSLIIITEVLVFKTVHSFLD